MVYRVDLAQRDSRNHEHQPEIRIHLKRMYSAAGADTWERICRQITHAKVYHLIFHEMPAHWPPKTGLVCVCKLIFMMGENGGIGSR